MSPATTAWWAPRSCAGWSAKMRNSARRPGSLDLTDQQRHRRLAGADAARCDFPGGRSGRRHSRQQYLSGRFHQRKFSDRAQRHPRSAHGRRKKAARARLLLHLSETGAAADAGGALLTGPLEPTNEWYAIAKIAAIKLCEAYRKQYGCDFISVMPTNLYGPNDNYHPKTATCPPRSSAAFTKPNRPCADGDRLGIGFAAARISLCRRSRRRVRFCDEALFRCRISQHRNGRRHHDRQFAELVADVVGYKGKLSTTRRVLTARRESFLTCPNSTILAGPPRHICAMAWRAPMPTFLRPADARAA